MLRRLLLLACLGFVLPHPAAAADIVYIYDALGRIVQIVYPAPNARTVTYTYDAAGNITNVTITP